MKIFNTFLRSIFLATILVIDFDTLRYFYTLSKIILLHFHLKISESYYNPNWMDKLKQNAHLDPETKKAEFYVLQNALIVRQFRNKNTVVPSYQRTFVNPCIPI